MANEIQFKMLENLLNLKEGQLDVIDSDNMTSFLTNSVKDKTDSLNQSLNQNNYLKTLPECDLVQKGLTLAELESDRQLIRDETFQVYRIGKALLVKLYDDVKDQVNVNDRMYTAIAKMLDSVNTSLAKLFEMNSKMKQEVEFKAIASGNDTNDNSKTMTIDDWMNWVDSAKNEETKQNSALLNATDLNED
jgi:hypothetical protein